MVSGQWCSRRLSLLSGSRTYSSFRVLQCCIISTNLRLHILCICTFPWLFTRVQRIIYIVLITEIVTKGVSWILSVLYRLLLAWWPKFCYGRISALTRPTVRHIHYTIWRYVGYFFSSLTAMCWPDAHWVFIIFCKGYCHCYLLSRSRYLLLNLPDTRRTTQHWQCSGRSVGPALIGLAWNSL